MSNPDTGETPMMAYASHVSAGTGRTPIGIIMFAASHLLLGGVLLLSAYVVYRQVNRRPGLTDWIVMAVLAALAAPMISGAVALLLKGHRAWAIAVASFVLVGALEAGILAYATGMLVRYFAQENPDAEWAMIFVAMTFGIGTMCIVVVGYLGGQKARNTFGLSPGETPILVRRLRPIVLTLFAIALVVGPMLRNIRWLYPD